MKFVTFLAPATATSVSDGTPPAEKLGLWIDAEAEGAKPSVVDALAAFEWIATLPSGSVNLQSRALPTDILTVIREQSSLLPVFRQIAELARQGKLPASLLQDAEALQLLSPIPRPVSMRDGYAFRQHVESARKNRGLPMIPEFDHFPVFYFTNHLAVTGPGDVVVSKLAQDQLDFELEVAIVIGKGGMNIRAEDADAHIFGYLIMNDWSARRLQMEEMKLNLGPAKGKDFATSLGPYLVTSDELNDRRVAGAQGSRHDLPMRAWVNGRKLSEGNLKDISWTFAQIIERASYGVRLHPGEVIGSGTVGTGCLLELNGSKITDNLWLKPGDEVVMEVERLGRLVNRVVNAEAAEPAAAADAGAQSKTAAGASKSNRSAGV